MVGKRLAVAVGKFGLISAAFVAVLLGSGYISMRLALLGRQVTVPDVTGMTVAAAQESLLTQELFLESAAEKHDDRLERGRVLAQEPAAGSPIKKDRKVKMVTSLRPRAFKVPDLPGESPPAAPMGIHGERLQTAHISY